MKQHTSRYFSESRRRLAVALVFSLGSVGLIRAAETGIKLHFIISARGRQADGRAILRTYENALLMSFGEGFSADFEDEFRLGLRAIEQGPNARIEISLNDLKRNSLACGKRELVAIPGDDATAEFGDVDGFNYSVKLKTERAALPKRG
jgi:hypothetical protein